MEWLSMYEVLLCRLYSNSKITKKTARVVFGTGTSTRNGKAEKFIIPRIDIRNYGAGTHNGVSFSNTEFEWFLNAVDSNNDSSVFVGYRTNIMTRLRAENAISISTAENDRIHGIVLTADEYKILDENRDYLAFLLKYRFAKGDQLAQVTKAIYISVLVNAIKKDMKESCDECVEGNVDDEMHYCKKDFNQLRNKSELVENAIKDPQNDGLF